MVSLAFKSIAQTIAKAQEDGVVRMTLNTYDLITLASLIEDNLPVSTPAPLVVDLSTHDGRVHVALNNSLVENYMRENKKIHAIKELRIAAACGLKEAKDAVEDDRVSNAFGLPLYRPAW